MTYPTKVKAQLLKLQKIADFQFGRGIGHLLFPADTVITISRYTRRIKEARLSNGLIATVSPKYGRILLTYRGAERLRNILPEGRFRVVVKQEIGEFVSRGSDVFSKHIVGTDREILPGEEVLVESEAGELLAVGRAVLAGGEIDRYKKGVAVRVKHSRQKRKSSE